MDATELSYRLRELTRPRCNVMTLPAHGEPMLYRARRDSDETVSFESAFDDETPFDEHLAELLSGGGRLLCALYSQADGLIEPAGAYAYVCRDGAAQETSIGAHGEGSSDRGCPFHFQLALDVEPDGLSEDTRELFELLNHARLESFAELTDCFARCADAALAHHLRTLGALEQDGWGDDDEADSQLLARYQDALDEDVTIEALSPQAAARTQASDAYWARLLANALIEENGLRYRTLTLDGLAAMSLDALARFAHVMPREGNFFVAVEDEDGHPTMVELGGHTLGVHGAFVHRFSASLITVTPILSLDPDRRRPELIRRVFPTMGYGDGDEPALTAEHFDCARYTDCKSASTADYLPERVLDASTHGTEIDIAECVCDWILQSLIRHGAPPPPPRKRQPRAKQGRRRSRR